MALARSSRGSYNVSGDATLNLRWSNISGRATDDTLTLTKKNIGGWGSINMGSGTDTVTLAAEGDYTLQLVGVETIKTTEAHTTLRFRSDATTSTDGSFESITAMYGVQNVTFTGATGGHSTLSLGELDDKATFSGSATNWVYNKDVHSTIYAYDLTTGYRIAINSDVETLNFAETDLLASSAIDSLTLYLTESGTSDISGLSIQGSPTSVRFTTGNDNLVATAAQLSSATSFDGLAGTDQITLSAAGTFNTTGKTLTSIDSINGSSGADTIVLTTAGITTNGNADADTITGSTGADSINGGAGADSILGGADADTLAGEGDADIIDGEAGADTITGGDGADTITGGTGLDSITGGGGADIVRYGTATAASNDTIVGFVSATDKVEVLLSLLENGTEDTTLSTTNIADWTDGFGGSLGANDVFVEFTDDTGAGSCDTAAEVDALLNPAGGDGVQINALLGGPNKIVLFLNDGTDGYLWYWSEAALGGGDVDDGELTLLAKLVGVTNIADGDLATYV